MTKYMTLAADLARKHYDALKRLREDGALLRDEAPADEGALVQYPNPIVGKVEQVETLYGIYGTERFKVRIGIYQLITNSAWMASVCSQAKEKGRQVRVGYVGKPFGYGADARMRDVDML